MNFRKNPVHPFGLNYFNIEQIDKYKEKINYILFSYLKNLLDELKEQRMILPTRINTSKYGDCIQLGWPYRDKSFLSVGIYYFDDYYFISNIIHLETNNIYEIKISNKQELYECLKKQL